MGLLQMPLEKNVSRTIMRVLDKAGLDPVRIESIGEGIPDINCTLGWIETKAADKWPARGGPLRIDHYTPEQRKWHRRRRNARGAVWVLLKVGLREWFLFDAAVAAKHLGHATKEELIAVAAGYWPSGLDKGEFLECLTSLQL